MTHVRLTSRNTGEKVILKANTSVLAWLWKNYRSLGYSEIEDLDAITRSGVIG